MPREELRRLIEVLQTAQEPMLIHCYHGVDRAGTASALAAWLRGGQPYNRAKWQAYVPSGPWKRPNGVHISDTLALYEDYCRRHGVNPDDRSLFKRWAREIYRLDGSSAAPDAPHDATIVRPHDRYSSDNIDAQPRYMPMAGSASSLLLAHLSLARITAL